ncbi:MAG: RIP metalloprotease RseP [Chloroflexi bacterium]|nr:RIP metalloprotease RseP [Chloroflexota bacterium]
MTTIIVFVVVFSVLVFVHELGHFLAARRAGVKIEEFAFGYPPRLLAIKRGGIDYALNLIPFGGYVRMAGEEDPSVPGSLASRSPRQRAAVLVAGPAMNLLLAILLFALAFSQGVVVGVSPEISSITADSPAAKAGLQVGDRILAIDDHSVRYFADIRPLIGAKNGQAVKVTVSRNGQVQDYQVQPQYFEAENRWVIGVVGNKPVKEYYPIWRVLFLAAGETFKVMALTLYIPVAVLQGLIPAQSVQPIGPVGIAQATGEIARLGLLPTLEFAAFLSVNLGIFNLLPIPALDGGRLVFVILEALRRGKRIAPEKEGLVHLLGLAALFTFLVAVSYFDLLRLFSGQRILP